MWENIAPMMVAIVFAMIPITVILTRHQQKMARILRAPVAEGQDQEIQRLSSEVRSLRDALYQQTMSIDRLEGMVRALPARTDGATERVS
jgi:hypothetical protein